MLPEGEDLVAIDESNPGWIKVTTEAGDGYISADYVVMTTDFVTAESTAEDCRKKQKSVRQQKKLQRKQLRKPIRPMQRKKQLQQ